MKVIDLILDYNDNKKLPEKIKVNGKIFKWDGLLTYSHQDFDKESYLFTDDYDWCAWLNDEVEIIEKDKKIEAINTISSLGIFDKRCIEEYFRIVFSQQKEEAIKINELIYEVNKLKEGKDE